MTRYVAKPVHIEAHQHLGKPFPIEFARAVMRVKPDGTIEVMTGDGPRVMKYRDYIARGSDGQFFVIREGLFLTNYEPALTAKVPFGNYDFTASAPAPEPVAVPPSDPLDAVTLVGAEAAAEASMPQPVGVFEVVEFPPPAIDAEPEPPRAKRAYTRRNAQYG